MMTDLQEMISGKKTYIALVVGMMAVAANHFGMWPDALHVNLDPSNWLNDEYKLLVAAFGRAAIAKV